MARKYWSNTGCLCPVALWFQRQQVGWVLFLPGRNEGNQKSGKAVNQEKFSSDGRMFLTKVQKEAAFPHLHWWARRKRLSQALMVPSAIACTAKSSTKQLCSRGHQHTELGEPKARRAEQSVLSWLWALTECCPSATTHQEWETS